MPTALKVLGKDLRPGDAIKVWYPPHYDRIVKLVPYEGRLAELWKGQGDVRMAHFERSKVPDVIYPLDEMEVVDRRA